MIAWDQIGKALGTPQNPRDHRCGREDAELARFRSQVFGMRELMDDTIFITKL